MAKKSLGYVELEWECPTCKVRNPGSVRTCQGCGLPQPPDVKFQAPGQAVVATDAETAKKATAGPDIHCPYCDARNPADAKVCKQCGGDLSGGESRAAGEIVSGFDAGAKPPVACPACGAQNVATARTCKNCGAPLPKVAAPVPVAKSNSGGCLWIAVGLVVVVVIGIVLMLFLGGGGERTTVTATVTEARWERSLEVLGLMPVTQMAWRDQIPADAEVGACVDEVRREVDDPVGNAREVCGTPYAVDQGTGFAEMVQDCIYQIIEQRCEYTINDWRVVDTLVVDGEGLVPAWPQLTSPAGQRPGARAEQYQCVFSADGAIYTYTTRDFDTYQACRSGATWTLEVDESGRVVTAAPSQ